jgi:cis-3-alkyl-4-acyloxetan-2-one decarboxylase
VVAVKYQSVYPFEPNYFSVPAGRIHFVDEGDRDAPVLLMLHGNPTWSFYYRNLITKFCKTHRVVAIDHLGCGLSDKPQRFAYTLANHIEHVEALVNHLQLKDLSLVLHDWGGSIGMGYAVRHPENIARFVLFNTAAFPSRHIPFSINICRIPGFGALAIRGLNAFARAALLRAAHHQDRITPQVRAGYLQPYDSWKNRVAHLRFVQDIPMSPRHPGYALLESIATGLAQFADHPMLIVWGAKDFCFNDHFLDEWRRRFPKARVHYVEDAGHYVVEDAHERISDWMEAFFDGRSS